MKRLYTIADCERVFGAFRRKKLDSAEVTHGERLLKLTKKFVKGKKRHDTACKIAAHMAGKGESFQKIYAYLSGLALTIQDRSRRAEFKNGELYNIVNSAIEKYGKKRLEPFTIAEGCLEKFLENEPPPFEWIITNFLAKGIVGLIFGEGGSFKSLGALQLVLKLSFANVLNTRWLDNFQIKDAVRVIYVTAEDSRTDMHHRVKDSINIMIPKKVKRADIYKAISENVLIYSREDFIKDGTLFLLNEKCVETAKVEKIIAIVKKHNADILVLDTFSRIFNIDENDNRQAARAIAVVERIRDETGATVLIVAHTGKVGRSRQTDTYGQNSLRGASALMDNARWGLLFRWKNRTTLEIVNAKNFRAPRAESFLLQPVYPGFYAVEEENVEDDLLEMVVADVRAHPGTTQRATIERLHRNGNHVNQAFKGAVETGRIERRERYKGYYCVNNVN